MQNRTHACVPLRPPVTVGAQPLAKPLPAELKAAREASEQPLSCFWLVSEHGDHALVAWLGPIKGFAGDGASPLFSCCRNPWRVLLEPEYQNIENQPQTLITAEDGCGRAGLVGSGLNLPEQVPGKGGPGEGAADKGRLIVTVRVTY